MRSGGGVTPVGLRPPFVTPPPPSLILIDAESHLDCRRAGCAPQTLNDWVKKAEIDTGQRGGITTEVAEKIKALERENRELKQANEILRKASAYFAQAELDRPFKR